MPAARAASSSLILSGTSRTVTATPIGDVGAEGDQRRVGDVTDVVVLDHQQRRVPENVAELAGPGPAEADPGQVVGQSELPDSPPRTVTASDLSLPPRTVTPAGALGCS